MSTPTTLTRIPKTRPGVCEECGDETALTFASGYLTCKGCEPDPLTTVTFQSGATRDLHPAIVPTVLGLSAEGRVVVQSEGMPWTFGLTLCCNAYDKGMEDGAGCRACYSLDDAGEYDAVVSDPVAKPEPERLPETLLAMLREAGAHAYRLNLGRAPMLSDVYHAAIEGLLVGDPRTMEAGLAYTTAYDAARDADGVDVPDADPRADLPLTEDGHVDTSAAYGHQWLVEVTYQTEHDGSIPSTDGPTPRTVHGPFTSEAEANAWVEDWPDGDTDVEDFLVMQVNSVRPAPAPEETHYFELERIELRVSDDPVKIDMEVVCTECETVLCDAEHRDGIDTLARVAAGHTCGEDPEDR